MPPQSVLLGEECEEVNTRLGRLGGRLEAVRRSAREYSIEPEEEPQMTEDLVRWQIAFGSLADAASGIYLMEEY